MKTLIILIAQLLFFALMQYNTALCSIGITSHTPSKNALNVSPSANITIQFNSSIDTSTLTNVNIRVNGSQSGLHPSVFSYNTSTNTVTINPNSNFKLSETVEVTITRRVKSTSNDSLAMPLVFRFTIIVYQGFTSYVKDTSFAMNNNPIGGIFGDVDNDGDLDEIISSHDEGIIRIYKNNGNGKFSLFTTLSGGGLAYTTYPPVCGDFNADGYLDVAVTVRFSNLVSVWFNNGDGTFSPAQQVSVAPEPDRINVSDYNGDGYLDFAVRCHSSSSYYMDILMNDKTGHFARTQRYPFPTRLNEQCSGDFDGDGDIDVALSTHDANFHVLINDGNGVFSEPIPTIPAIGNMTVTGDIDNDGDLDVIVNISNGVTILKNNGAGVFTRAQDIGAAGNTYGYKVLRDLDADGDLDLIVPNHTQNKEEFYINDGTGHFTAGYVINGWSSNNAYEIDAGDLDGNGNLDLAGPDAGSFVVYKAVTPLPPAPSLISPVDGSMGIPLSPVMDWNDVPAGLSYRLQISTDIVFNNIVFDSAGISASTITVPAGKLNGNTIYHWRVNTSNASGTGNWSTVWAFTTSIPIGVPVLVSPTNNSTIATITPTLIWNNISSAVNYNLQMSLDSLFLTYVISDSLLTHNYYFMPSGLLSNFTRYYWRVNAKNSNGWSGFSTIWNFRIEIVTKISNYKNGTPDEYKLYDNFPNPFNPVTKIRFDLPKSSNAKITIYDINGREISQLINGVLKAGYYEISWDAGRFSSGVYFYRFESDKFICVKKMLMIK